MVYITTLTKKGQITIPKEIREALNLKEGRKLEVELTRRKGEIRIKPSPDILDIAGTIKPKKVVSAVKIRELMVKKYRSR